MVFRVHILRLSHSTADLITYVLNLHPEGDDSERTPFIEYGGDAALCEALVTLNVAESQQQLVLSVLRNVTHESFLSDISEDVARQFGWRRAM